MNEVHLIGIDGVIGSIAPITRLRVMPRSFDSISAEAKAFQKVVQVAIKPQTNAIAVGRSNIRRVSNYIQLLSKELNSEDLVATSCIVSSRKLE